MRVSLGGDNDRLVKGLGQALGHHVVPESGLGIADTVGQLQDEVTLADLSGKIEKLTEEGGHGRELLTSIKWTAVQKSQVQIQLLLGQPSRAVTGVGRVIDTSRREGVQLRVSIPMVELIEPAELDRRLPHRFF